MKRILAVPLAALLLGGCATITYEANSSKPVLLGSGVEKDHDVLRGATDRSRQLWLFWWFIPVGEDRGQTLGRIAESGDGLKNVTIHEHYGVVDFLVQNWSAIFLVPGITNTLQEDFTADVIEFDGEGERR